jgi:hypothetical protein
MRPWFGRLAEFRWAPAQSPEACDRRKATELEESVDGSSLGMCNGTGTKTQNSAGWVSLADLGCAGAVCVSIPGRLSRAFSEDFVGWQICLMQRLDLAARCGSRVDHALAAAPTNVSRPKLPGHACCGKRLNGREPAASGARTWRIHLYHFRASVRPGNRLHYWKHIYDPGAVNRSLTQGRRGGGARGTAYPTLAYLGLASFHVGL